MSKEIVKFADDAMHQAAPIQREPGEPVRPKVHLLSATPDPLGVIAAACSMYGGKPCYSLADITDEDRKYHWQQAMATHLKAPLEFVHFHFFIEGVTRSFTHQMVRQRTV
jgi:thymidylate synthase (FAD)